MNAAAWGALGFALVWGGLSSRAILGALNSEEPQRFGAAYLFPSVVMDALSHLIDFFRGIFLLPILTEAFHLAWLPASVAVLSGLAACIWAPINPKPRALAFLLGILLSIQTSTFVLALAVALLVFALFGKPWLAIFSGIITFMLFLWAFIPASPYPALALGVLGLAYAHWWRAARDERPVV